MPANKQVNTRLPDDMIRAIKDMAKAEQRPVSQMIRVLLAQAIKARAGKDG